jgi:RNA polymerase sigma-70 factor (ECF subfamily)
MRALLHVVWGVVLVRREKCRGGEQSPKLAKLTGDQYNPRSYTRPTFMSQLNATPQSDYDLTQAIESGVVSKIGDLYERHKPFVYSICLRMTRNMSEAEDLTQEIFIELLSKVGSFRGESQFSSWLYRFTTNHVLMYFRRVTRRRERFPYLADEFDATYRLGVSFGPQFLDRIALDAAVAKLSSGARSVFLKFDIEGYSHQEIAAIFGCSVGNSKSQLHKARRRLRKLLTTKMHKRGKVYLTQMICAFCAFLWLS